MSLSLHCWRKWQCCCVVLVISQDRSCIRSCLLHWLSEGLLIATALQWVSCCCWEAVLQPCAMAQAPPGPQTSVPLPEPESCTPLIAGNWNPKAPLLLQAGSGRWMCLVCGHPGGAGPWCCAVVTGRSCFLQTLLLRSVAVIFTLLCSSLASCTLS